MSQNSQKLAAAFNSAWKDSQLSQATSEELPSSGTPAPPSRPLPSLPALAAAAGQASHDLDSGGYSVDEEDDAIEEAAAASGKKRKHEESDDDEQKSIAAMPTPRCKSREELLRLAKGHEPFNTMILFDVPYEPRALKDLLARNNVRIKRTGPEGAADVAEILNALRFEGDDVDPVEPKTVSELLLARPVEADQRRAFSFRCWALTSLLTI